MKNILIIILIYLIGSSMGQHDTSEEVDYEFRYHYIILMIVSLIGLIIITTCLWLSLKMNPVDIDNINCNLCCDRFHKRELPEYSAI